MKLKTITKRVAGTYTRDGVTVPVTRTEESHIPELPVDWQKVALRTAVGIVLTLTLITVVWSTHAIGRLLGGGIGYTAAIIFDLGWAMALLMEYLARYDRRKRVFPERLGWALLVITMVAIAADSVVHGSIKDPATWATAIIGALISLISKLLWIGVMRHVNAELSADDEAWVADQLSAAQAKAAVAQMRRQAARTEQAAMLELLAMERERSEVSQAFGLDTTTAKPIEASANGYQALALETPTLADMGKADAVRFVLGQRPELEPVEIADVLGDHGVEVDPSYVKQVVNRSRPEMAEVVELRK